MNMAAKLRMTEGWKITKQGGKLLVDISIPTWGKTLRRYYQTEKIVYYKKSDIIAMGYRPAEGLKSDLAYYNMPVYVRFNNWKVCDYVNGFTDQYGRPCAEDAGAYP